MPVRFEKTTQVVVHQSATTAKARRALRHAGDKPVYKRWWVWAAVAAGAILTGTAIGFAVPHQGVVDCSKMPCP